MGANPVTWFELPVKDLSRARAFYEEVFETRLEPLDMGGIKMAWFPRDDGAPGVSGGLVEGQGRQPSGTGTLVFFNVADIDSTLSRIERSGGKIVMPRSGGAEQGAMAQFEDTEGNVVALFSKG